MIPTTSLSVEQRKTTNPQAISLDVARHMSKRLGAGRIAVISNRPTVLLAVVRKRWVKLIRDVERQRCCTLNHELRKSLDDQLDKMQTVQFGTQAPLGKNAPDICFIEQKDTYALAKCQTVYVTEDVCKVGFLSIARNLPKETHVVVYGAWLPEHDEALAELSAA